MTHPPSRHVPVLASGLSFALTAFFVGALFFTLFPAKPGTEAIRLYWLSLFGTVSAVLGLACLMLVWRKWE